ncbi:MAG: alkaline phosphatase PhoX [Gemmatimonadota bacterium]
MTRLDRREFLCRAGRYVGAAALAPSLPGLLACAAEPDAGRPSGRMTGPGYGPLEPAGPELALPPGFRYVRFGVEGDPMSDGRPTPRAHDGMAAFPLDNGHVRLIRNHEDGDPPGQARPLCDAEVAYDPRAGGGTTSLEIRIAADGTPELVRDFASLGGTIVNCAGGPTPWGTWLSCEETTRGGGQGWSLPHGYVFEVPVEAESPVRGVPLVAMGRFTHEAIAVDPETGVVYETEDLNRRSGFYRFLPSRRGELRAGGRLEMLAVSREPRADLRRDRGVGARWTVEWVPIAEPDPAWADRNPGAVFEQGFEAGGARLSRLEGCWYADRSIYFHSTNGGAAGCGQVWRYHPAEEELTLVFESPSEEVLDGPDNLTVSPRGAVLICEDGGRSSNLRGLTAEGLIFDFARNIVNPREFAGACFSPDGSVLFVNIQGDLNSWGPGHRGMTFAIWGPWEEGLA